mgnify:CR=1 FL=1
MSILLSRKLGFSHMYFNCIETSFHTTFCQCNEHVEIQIPWLEGKYMVYLLVGMILHAFRLSCLYCNKRVTWLSSFVSFFFVFSSLSLHIGSFSHVQVGMDIWFCLKINRIYTHTNISYILNECNNDWVQCSSWMYCW